MKAPWRVFRRRFLQPSLQTITFYAPQTGNALYTLRWSEVRSVMYSPGDKSATFYFRPGSTETHLTVTGIDTDALARDLSVYG